MGIIPRIARDIFDHIYSMDENLEFHIKVMMSPQRPLLCISCQRHWVLCVNPRVCLRVWLFAAPPAGPAPALRATTLPVQATFTDTRGGNKVGLKRVRADASLKTDGLYLD